MAVLKTHALKRTQVKTHIELCTAPEKVNEIIEKYYHFDTFKEKIAFLEGMYDFEVVDRKSSDNDEDVYNILLDAIVSKKFY